MEHLSPERRQRIEKWRRWRDLAYLAVLVWIIFDPGSAIWSLQALGILWICFYIVERIFELR